MAHSKSYILVISHFICRFKIYVKYRFYWLFLCHLSFGTVPNIPIQFKIFYKERSEENKRTLMKAALNKSQQKEGFHFGEDGVDILFPYCSCLVQLTPWML